MAAGIVDFATANADPAAHTYPFHHSADIMEFEHNADVMEIATLSLGQLGMSSADYLIYGYAWSPAPITEFTDPGLVVENVVTLSVE